MRVQPEQTRIQCFSIPKENTKRFYSVVSKDLNWMGGIFCAGRIRFDLIVRLNFTLADRADWVPPELVFLLEK